MNEEYKRGWMTSFKIIVAGVLATLGWLWGRGMSGTMRFWLPAIIAGVCMISEVIQKKEWKWGTFLLYSGMVALAYGLMTAFAYGAGSWLRPLGVIAQRFIVGFMWAVPYTIVAFVNRCKKIWILLGLHIVVVTLFMGVIGGFDLLSAPEVEGLTRGILALLPPFMVTWKN